MILQFKKVLSLNYVSVANAAGFVRAIKAEPINKHLLFWNKLVDRLHRPPEFITAEKFKGLTFATGRRCRLIFRHLTLQELDPYIKS